MSKDTAKEKAIIAFAGSFEEASQQYAELVRGDVEAKTFDCNNIVVASAAPMAFDVYQGVEAKEAEAEFNIQAVASAIGDEVEAHHFVCVSKSCGTHVIASDESTLFCPACSGGLLDPADIATASDDEEEEEEEEEEDEEEDFEEDDEEEDDEEEDDEDDEDDAITLSVSSASYGERVRKKAKATSAEPLVSVAASLVAYAGSEMTADKVDVAFAGNVAGEQSWFAFYEGVPFAKATASSTKVKENFSSEVFGRTFKAIAADKGVATAMDELGFVEIKPEIKVEQFVQSQVESQVEARTASIAEASARDAQEFNDRFLAAIATASQGINRGFYRGMQNPIRVALASALEEVGVQGAEQLVAQAFNKHGDDYHKQLVEQASKIMQYDLTVQNQMAKAVSEHQEPEEEETQVSVSSSVPVGRPVAGAKPQPQRETAVASSQNKPSDFSNKLKTLHFGKR